MTIKMNEKFKRYLLLIPIMVLLTACGNDAQVNSAETVEIAETVENIESDDESIKNEKVDITYDKAETHEEAVKDSEKVEANFDINLRPTEVYELFLNGELTL